MNTCWVCGQAETPKRQLRWRDGVWEHPNNGHCIMALKSQLEALQEAGRAVVDAWHSHGYDTPMTERVDALAALIPPQEGEGGES